MKIFEDNVEGRSPSSLDYERPMGRETQTSVGQ